MVQSAQKTFWTQKTDPKSGSPEPQGRHPLGGRAGLDPLLPLDPKKTSGWMPSSTLRPSTPPRWHPEGPVFEEVVVEPVVEEQAEAEDEGRFLSPRPASDVAAESDVDQPRAVPWGGVLGLDPVFPDGSIQAPKRETCKKEQKTPVIQRVDF